MPRGGRVGFVGGFWLSSRSGVCESDLGWCRSSLLRSGDGRFCRRLRRPGPATQQGIMIIIIGHTRYVGVSCAVTDLASERNDVCGRERCGGGAALDAQEGQVITRWRPPKRA